MKNYKVKGKAIIQLYIRTIKNIDTINNQITEQWEDTVWSTIEEARRTWPKEKYRKIFVIKEE